MRAKLTRQGAVPRTRWCVPLLLSTIVAIDVASGQTSGRTGGVPNVATPGSPLPANPTSDIDERLLQAAPAESPLPATAEGLASSRRDVRWRLNRWGELSASVSAQEQEAFEKYLRLPSHPKWARWELTDVELEAIETFFRDRKSHAAFPGIQHLPQVVSGLEKIRAGIRDRQPGPKANLDPMEPHSKAWEEVNKLVIDRDVPFMERFVADEQVEQSVGTPQLSAVELETLEAFVSKRSGKTNAITLSNLEELTTAVDKFYRLRGGDLKEEPEAASDESESVAAADAEKGEFASNRGNVDSGPVADRAPNSVSTAEGDSDPARPSAAIAANNNGKLMRILASLAGALAALAAVGYAGHRIWWKNRTGKRAWRVIEAPQKLGDVELRADGSFSISGMSWDQGSSIGGTPFGSLRARKKAGVNQTLTIQEGRSTTKLIFDGENWKMLC